MNETQNISFHSILSDMAIPFPAVSVGLAIHFRSVISEVVHSARALILDKNVNPGIVHDLRVHFQDDIGIRFPRYQTIIPIERFELSGQNRENPFAQSGPIL